MYTHTQRFVQTGKHIEKSRYLHHFGLELASLQSSNSDRNQMLISSESSPRHVLLNQTLNIFIHTRIALLCIVLVNWDKFYTKLSSFFLFKMCPEVISFKSTCVQRTYLLFFSQTPIPLWSQKFITVSNFNTSSKYMHRRTDFMVQLYPSSCHIYVNKSLFF